MEAAIGDLNQARASGKAFLRNVCLGPRSGQRAGAFPGGGGSDEKHVSQRIQHVQKPCSVVKHGLLKT